MKKFNVIVELTDEEVFFS